MADENGKVVNLDLDMIIAQTNEEAQRCFEDRTQLLNHDVLPALKEALALKQIQEEQIERVEADVDVTNLSSDFSYSVKCGNFERAYNCFALKTEGVSMEISGAGIYEGAQAIKSYIMDYLPRLGGDAGSFVMRQLASPVIEIAADGQSAKGMWLSHGINAWMRPDLGEAGDPLSLWTDAWICMDFVKEDGQWKILHYYQYEEEETVYEKSWSESADDHIPADPRIPAASAPSEKHNPYTSSRRPYLPAQPPVPYTGCGCTKSL